MRKEQLVKANKRNIVDFIVETAKTAKFDKDLTSRVNYTLKGFEKDEKDVPKSTLKELAEDIIDFLAKSVPAPAPIEASAKPVLKKPAPKADPTPAPATPAPAKTAEAPKKTLAKPGAKTDQTVKTTADLTTNSLPIATIFPDEIDHKSLGKLKRCAGKFKKVAEIAKAVEEGKELIFATYWTKRHLKEFDYARLHEVPVPKDGFPYDLDTLQPVYVCEGVPAFYAISTYTEAMFRFKEDDLAYVECTAPDNTKFKMRYTAGMEYEVYEIVAEK
jgi:hypothetical protein